jgi:mRNA interferase RelE/StbE
LTWRIEFTPPAAKALRKLDRPSRQKVVGYLDALLESCSSPRDRGQGLTANLSGFWRYRIGDLRLICKIRDQELIVLVVEIGHRSSVY